MNIQTKANETPLKENLKEKSALMKLIDNNFKSIVGCLCWNKTQNLKGKKN